MRGVVLVEGRSDEAAVRALAERLGRDLVAEGVSIEVVGGAGGFARAMARLGPGVRVAALVDVGEVEQARRSLERAGLGGDLDALGFRVCDLDLEDELIRSLGVDAVTDVVVAAGERRMLRAFQEQPAQRDRPLDAQLRRFLGTKAGRKIRYGRLLVQALPLDAVPTPLAAALAAV
jgi:hypothetical protein